MDSFCIICFKPKNPYKVCPDHPRCVLNCGFPSCVAGNPHFCKACNYVNEHRMSDCPKQKALSNRSPSTNLAKLFSPAKVTEQKQGPMLSIPVGPLLGADGYWQYCDTISNGKYPNVPEALGEVNVAGVILIAKLGDKHWVLQQRRSASLGGFVLFPGGSIDRGEKYFESARREFLEEAGKDLSALKATPISVLFTRMRSGTAKVANVIYSMDCSNVLPTWQNTGTHRGECSEFEIAGNQVRACYGHAWTPVKDIKNFARVCLVNLA